MLRLAAGLPLRMVCRQPDMPSRSAVYNWRAADPEFDRVLRCMQYEGQIALAERVFEEVNRLVDTHGPERARLVFNTRRWQLHRLHPQFFGW